MQEGNSTMSPVRRLQLDPIRSGMVLMAMLGFSGFTPAMSQEGAKETATQNSSNPLLDIARKAKLLPEPIEPKDFVKQSRPAQTDFLPVNTMPADRKLKVKTTDELKAMQAELEAARLHHDQISGRPKPTAHGANPTEKKLKGSLPGRAGAKDPKA
jgi:hypothetical protein